MDARATKVVRRCYDDIALFGTMAQGGVPAFMRLIAGMIRTRLAKLSARFDGFTHEVTIPERIAGGSASGDLRAWATPAW